MLGLAGSMIRKPSCLVFLIRVLLQISCSQRSSLRHTIVDPFDICPNVTCWDTTLTRYRTPASTRTEPACKAVQLASNPGVSELRQRICIMLELDTVSLSILVDTMAVHTHLIMLQLDTVSLSILVDTMAVHSRLIMLQLDTVSLSIPVVTVPMHAHLAPMVLWLVGRRQIFQVFQDTARRT